MTPVQIHTNATQGIARGGSPAALKPARGQDLAFLQQLDRSCAIAPTDSASILVQAGPTMLAPTLAQAEAAATAETPAPAETPVQSATKGESREAVGQRFESLFLKKLVEELRISAGGEEGLFGSGPGSGMQEDWFDQIFADHLAASGGFGFARMLPKDTPQ